MRADAAEPRFRDSLRVPEIRAAMLGTFVVLFPAGKATDRVGRRAPGL